MSGIEIYSQRRPAITRRQLQEYLVGRPGKAAPPIAEIISHEPARVEGGIPADDKRESLGMSDNAEEQERKQPRKMLNQDEVLGIVPIGRTTLFRMVRLGTFPKPHYISPNRRAWYEDEVIAWQRALPDTRRGNRLRGKQVPPGATSGN